VRFRDDAIAQIWAPSPAPPSRELEDLAVWMLDHAKSEAQRKLKQNLTIKKYMEQTTVTWRQAAAVFEMLPMQYRYRRGAPGRADRNRKIGKWQPRSIWWCAREHKQWYVVSGRLPCLGFSAQLMLEFIGELGLSRMSQGHNRGNPPVDKGLLTVRQVAENWQVSERTIRRMIVDGRLPVIRLGRAVRIPAKAATD
jgi:excisionase family DNA binding protein